MEEKARNSDLVEMGIDEYAESKAPVKAKEEKPKKVKKESKDAE